MAVVSFTSQVCYLGKFKTNLSLQPTEQFSGIKVITPQAVSDTKHVWYNLD